MPVITYALCKSAYQGPYSDRRCRYRDVSPFRTEKYEGPENDVEKDVEETVIRRSVGLQSRGIARRGCFRHVIRATRYPVGPLVHPNEITMNNAVFRGRGIHLVGARRVDGFAMFRRSSA